MALYQKLKKHHPSSYVASPLSRQILLRGKAVLNKSYTAIVEEAIQEWGLKHLTSDVLAQYEALMHSLGATDAP